jgi:hypothetical protein
VRNLNPPGRGRGSVVLRNPLKVTLLTQTGVSIEYQFQFDYIHAHCIDNSIFCHFPGSVSMTYRILIVTAFLIICGTVYAQQADSLKAPAADTTKVVPVPVAAPPAPAGDTTKVVPPPVAAPQETAGPKKVYFGGYVGATFGNYSTFSVSPLIGYHLSPIVSGGLRFTYEYVNDKRYDPSLTASNYGGSVFLIGHIHPNAYLQAEFEYMSYEYSTANNSSTRNWVPFLYLGGGVAKHLGGNTSLVVSVMFDVLQDSKSPYESWSPMVTVGVVSGF